MSTLFEKLDDGRDGIRLYGIAPPKLASTPERLRDIAAELVDRLRLLAPDGLVVYDIQDQRDEAVNEYRAALTVRDGQADTRLAAEKGLKQPYAVPKHEHTEPQGDEDPAP